MTSKVWVTFHRTMKEGKISSRSKSGGARQKKHFNFLEPRNKSPIRVLSVYWVWASRSAKERRQMDSHRNHNEFQLCKLSLANKFIFIFCVSLSNSGKFEMIPLKKPELEELILESFLRYSALITEYFLQFSHFWK